MIFLQLCGVPGGSPRGRFVCIADIPSNLANRQEFERHLRPEDLLLVPPFPPDMGILDWHRHTELMEATYRWALHELARLQAAGHPALASADS